MPRLTALMLAVLIAVALLAGRTDAQEATPAPASGDVRLLDEFAIEAPEDVRLLALSPDGRLIAGAKGRDELCVYAVETMAEEACADLSGLDAGIRLDDVVWSPDSTRLAFGEEAFVYFRDGDLWVMDAATGEITNVDDDGFAGERLPIIGDAEPNKNPITLPISPAWSPDGETIAFSRSTIRRGNWAGNDIATVAPTGGEVGLMTRVTLDMPGVVYAAMQYAPDGATLVYGVAYPDPDAAANGFYAVDTATGLQRRILAADPELGTPSPLQISADGRLALVFFPLAAARATAGQTFYAIVDLETGEQTFLESDADSPRPSVGLATLSPDGTQVLQYERLLTDDGDRLVVVDLATGDRQTLVEGIAMGTILPTTQNGRGLFWSASGTIYATSMEGGTIFTVEPSAVSDRPAATPDTEATTAATPGSSGGEFAAGATVTVNDNDVPLRAAPATGAQTVATLALDTELTVVGPPVEGDGFAWIPVIDPATGTIGYVREEFLSELD